jgi:sulfur dioxygenase
MLVFRQLFESQSSTYTYLVADRTSGEAVLIDPVFDQARRDIALMAELGLTLKYSLETHVHADHVTSAWVLRERLGSQIALSAATGAEGADCYLAHGDRIEFGSRSLAVHATPGHTKGCVTYVLDDRTMAFTGDALLIRGCGRTDFQGGDANGLYRSVHAEVFSLPDDCLLYPGHDYRGLTVTSVGEEKRFNPRLGERVGEADFVGYMNHLGLAHPKQIDIAVPANLRCGRPERVDALDAEPSWAPLTYTFAGIWEIQPEWLEEHLHDVRIIDVREPDEFNGPLGHIPSAELMPLGVLVKRAQELPRDRPIVTVCRSGARSAQATVRLRNAGFERVANLAGGMLRWRAKQLVVEGASD